MRVVLDAIEICNDHPLDHREPGELGSVVRINLIRVDQRQRNMDLPDLADDLASLGLTTLALNIAEDEADRGARGFLLLAIARREQRDDLRTEILATAEDLAHAIGGHSRTKLLMEIADLLSDPNRVYAAIEDSAAELTTLNRLELYLWLAERGWQADRLLFAAEALMAANSNLGLWLRAITSPSERLRRVVSSVLEKAGPSRPRVEPFSSGSKQTVLDLAFRPAIVERWEGKRLLDRLSNDSTKDHDLAGRILDRIASEAPQEQDVHGYETESEGVPLADQIAILDALAPWVRSLRTLPDRVMRLIHELPREERFWHLRDIVECPPVARVLADFLEQAASNLPAFERAAMYIALAEVVDQPGRLLLQAEDAILEIDATVWAVIGDDRSSRKSSRWVVLDSLVRVHTALGLEVGRIEALAETLGPVEHARMLLALAGVGHRPTAMRKAAMSIASSVDFADRVRIHAGLAACGDSGPLLEDLAHLGKPHSFPATVIALAAAGCDPA
jgi:hypothetical protein